MDPFVLVISTGGTIASTADTTGARVPTLTGEELVRRCDTDANVRVYDAANLDSSSITLADLDLLSDLVRRALADAQISGIVLTHGTDSMAETALALDLVHDDPRPVILTGAQRPADDPHPDGPENLRRAIEAAGDRLRRGMGVLVHFAGETLPARGLYKASTEDLGAFALTSERSQPRPAAVPRSELAGLNVPILRAWPGADATIVDAVAASCPDGLVIEALGSGNVSGQMGEAIGRAVAGGIPVVIATSVPRGAVTFAYGGTGGGSTLGELGALPAGYLSPGQARIALLTALAAGVDPALTIAAL
ncbi:asparaginase [Corynebacterium aquatimens]|uniref:asparaginase n=1 Tax=Corynebacterium TaxID=1716 RepID=UPI001F22B05C|nr:MULTISPECIES: asparaginase [Corynebacterium]QYH19496.1 asparaginase [Corynebacterium aquatimens]UIZ91565.1 asparaginase [Corynebacterium sp. CNCTC7651]